MDKSKEIFWEAFQGTGIDAEIFSILYDAAITKIEKADSTHARIKKFNQLIEPQLLELDEYERELATMFLIGYLKGHIPIYKIEEISDQLGTFIERDLG